MQKSLQRACFCAPEIPRVRFLGEALLNHRGKGRFQAYSAGSHPAGRVNPFALKQLESAGLPVEGLRSKSWDEFAKPGAPQMHFVFTVCDSAAAEICPVWPGQPVTAHWGIPDPASVTGPPEEIARAFLRCVRNHGPPDRSVFELADGKAGHAGGEKRSRPDRATNNESQPNLPCRESRCAPRPA